MVLAASSSDAQIPVPNVVACCPVALASEEVSTSMYLARAPFQIRAASETPAPLRCLQEIGSVLRPLKNEYLLAQSFAVEHKASEGLDFGLMCFFFLGSGLDEDFCEEGES